MKLLDPNTLQSNSRADGVDEDVLVVAASLPHGEASHAGAGEVLALGSQRLGVVVGNPDLSGLVVHEGGHAAVVEAGGDALERLASLVEELGLGDQTPEGVGAGGGRGVAALVDARVVVPAAALEAVGAVLNGVGVQRVAVGEGVRGVDGEAMAVGTDGEDKLVGGDAGVDPLLDALLGAALVVTGVAGVGEGRVGSAGGSPGAVYVVGHDHEVVELLGEAGEGAVDAADAGGIIPGEQAGGGGQVELLGLLLAELLEEGQEVGGVVLVDGVAAETLAVGVLPVKVETVEVVL